MLTGRQIVPAGFWQPPALDWLELDFEQRYRRRFVFQTQSGLEFLLDLPKARLIKNGDAVELEDGRFVEIRAAHEDLVQISGRSPHHLLQLTWHLGNRHVPVMILPDQLYIRPDHVLIAMIEGLGGTTTKVQTIFEPIAGAYDHGHRHE